MNILITGSNGFIGRNLTRIFRNKYNYSVTELNRNVCDLLDPKSVDEFFIQQNTKYDLVIHTAVEGGRRNKPDNPELVYHNLLMLYNLLSHQNYFQCLISFGSGAELDRRHDINSTSINRYPVDPYGLCKNVIDKLCDSEPKLCNFRIYNCFGSDEQPDRMIRNNITRYLNKQDIVLHNNRKMDFFYIEDLAALIYSFIDHNNIPKTFDCCYAEKYTLMDIANLINDLDTHKVNIVTNEQAHTNPINALAKDYIGATTKINVNYIGLKQAMQIMYNEYKGLSV